MHFDGENSLPYAKVSVFVIESFIFVWPVRVKCNAYCEWCIVKKSSLTWLNDNESV